MHQKLLVMVLIRELETIKPHYMGLVVQRVNDTNQQINCNPADKS